MMVIYNNDVQKIKVPQIVTAGFLFWFTYVWWQIWWM